MAHIEKRGDSYRFIVSAGVDTNGKYIYQKLTYTPTAKSPKAIEKEVAAAARDFEKQVKEGKYLSGEKISFQDITERWLTEWAADHHTDQGARYLECIKRYAYPAFGTKKISKITALDLQDVMLGMKEKGLTPKTIRTVLTSINSVFRFAYRLNIIQENPVDRIERPRLDFDEDLHYFTVDQAKRFLAALSEPYTETVKAHTRIDDTGKPYSVPAYTMKRILPLQHQAYFTLAIFGGFRRGELGALTWNDIDFKNHTVTISKAVARRKGHQIIKEPKTKSGIRTVTLPAVCFDLLRKWKKEQIALHLKLGSAWQGTENTDEQFIFITETGALADISSVRKRFHDIIRRYNATCENEADKLPLIRLHDLRHTSASLLVASGADIATISRRLGHSKISTTLDIYSHALPENDKAASDILDKVLSC